MTKEWRHRRKTRRNSFLKNSNRNNTLKCNKKHFFLKTTVRISLRQNFKTSLKNKHSYKYLLTCDNNIVIEKIEMNGKDSLHSSVIFFLKFLFRFNRTEIERCAELMRNQWIGKNHRQSFNFWFFLKKKKKLFRFLNWIIRFEVLYSFDH